MFWSSRHLLGDSGRGYSPSSVSSAQFPSLYREAIRGLSSGIVAVVFWAINKDAENNHLAAEAIDQDRLVALRGIADQDTQEFPCVNNDHRPREERASEPSPDMIFAVVTNGGVELVDLFLNQQLLDKLNENDPVTWEGLILYIEDDIANR